MMQPESRILVTGANGMVGRALVAELRRTFSSVIEMTRADCDLEDRSATIEFFKKVKPEFVFHLAAKVGGIAANMADPVGFLQSNALIGCHVLEACWKAKVRKTLLLGSSCVYPRESPQPMREDYLLTGPLEPTNEGYALAKILTLKLGQFYHSQFGLSIVCPMPSNIYGTGDTFDLERSHVLSALVRRFVDARKLKLKNVTLWGTGQARREFIHVHDVVRGLSFFMNHVKTSEIINLGPGHDVSIRELALMIADLVGYSGLIEWDATRPDGMPRKCMDVTALHSLGFQTLIQLRDGVAEVIREYETQV